MPPFVEFDAGWVVAGLVVIAMFSWTLLLRDDALEPHDDWDEFDPEIRRDDPEDVTRRSQF